MDNVEVVYVTPDIAREWLTHNTHNRNPRPRSITAYATDMRDGNWLWNGESIKFSRDGTLLDGQNRLRAVIQAEVPINMLVIRDLPNETQETMDGGIKRKFSDILQLRGESNYAPLAAIVRRVHMWEAGVRMGGTGGGRYSPSNAQLLQTLEKYPELRDLTTSAATVARHCGLPGSLVGFCWWLFVQLDNEDAQYFFERLGDELNHKERDPIYVLRRTVANTRDVRGGRSLTFLLAITIKAWNAYRQGQEISVLKFSPGGARPERFPEPI